jgi:hypothetical protein
MNRTWPFPKSGYDLQRLIADALGIEKLPKAAWDDLEDGAYTGILDPPDRQGVLDCIDRVRWFLQRHPELPGGQTTRHDDQQTTVPSQLLREGDEARAVYFSKHVGSLARQRIDVLDLRRRFWNGRPLKEHEAGQFLTSHATRLMSWEHFELTGTPLIGHTTETLTPDGRAAHSWDEGVYLLIKWSDGETPVPYARSWFFGAHKHSIAIPARQGGFYRTQVVDGSVLDDVRKLSVSLANSYPWEEHEAVWFVLTNILPMIGPIRSRVHATRSPAFHDGRITLTIEPWVTADTVANVYRDLQLQHFLPVGRSHLPKQFALYQFVSKRRRAGRRSQTWDAIKSAWHKSIKRVVYDHFRPFRRDYERARRWVETYVLFPEYRIFDETRASKRPKGKSPRSRSRGVGKRTSP